MCISKKKKIFFFLQTAQINNLFFDCSSFCFFIALNHLKPFNYWIPLKKHNRSTPSVQDMDIALALSKSLDMHKPNKRSFITELQFIFMQKQIAAFALQE